MGIPKSLPLISQPLILSEDSPELIAQKRALREKLGYTNLPEYNTYDEWYASAEAERQRIMARSEAYNDSHGPLNSLMKTAIMAPLILGGAGALSGLAAGGAGAAAGGAGAAAGSGGAGIGSGLSVGLGTSTAPAIGSGLSLGAGAAGAGTIGAASGIGALGTGAGGAMAGGSGIFGLTSGELSLIGTGLGALGGVLGSNTASDAATDAANTQAAASDRAAQLQNDAFQQSQSYMDPYRRGGYTAAPLLEYLTTGSMEQLSPQDIQQMQALQGLSSRDVNQQTQLDQFTGRQNAMNISQGGLQDMITNSPMYQYQQRIGEKNLNRQLSARGRGNSSFGINALSDFNQSLTANESQNMYNRIADQASAGQGMARTAGQNAMTTGRNVGNLMQSSGNAIAQGQLSSGQQQASMYSNLGALPMQAYGNYQMINSMQPAQQAVAPQQYNNPYMNYGGR